MPDIEAKPLTAKQREKFLETVRDEQVGTREALRRAGVNAGSTALPVTHAYAKALLAGDDELRRDYEIARGRDLDKVEGVVFQIATDPRHNRALDAAKFLLERRDSRYGAKTALNVNHSGGVEIEDRSASLDAVAAVLVAVGALNVGGTPRPELPAARALLAESSES